MNVAELIKLLKELPDNTEVVMFDNEWGTYDNVLAVEERTADVTVHIQEPTFTTLFPDEDRIPHSWRKTGSIKVVELISIQGRVTANAV